MVTSQMKMMRWVIGLEVYSSIIPNPENYYDFEHTDLIILEIRVFCQKCPDLRGGAWPF